DGLVMNCLPPASIFPPVETTAAEPPAPLPPVRERLISCAILMSPWLKTRRLPPLLVTPCILILLLCGEGSAVLRAKEPDWICPVDLLIVTDPPVNTGIVAPSEMLAGLPVKPLAKMSPAVILTTSSPSEPPTRSTAPLDPLPLPEVLIATGLGPLLTVTCPEPRVATWPSKATTFTPPPFCPFKELAVMPLFTVTEPPVLEGPVTVKALAVWVKAAPETMVTLPAVWPLSVRTSFKDMPLPATTATLPPVPLFVFVFEPIILLRLILPPALTTTFPLLPLPLPE